MKAKKPIEKYQVIVEIPDSPSVTSVPLKFHIANRVASKFAKMGYSVKINKMENIKIELLKAEKN